MTIAPVATSNTIEFQRNRINELIDAVNSGSINFISIATEASLPSPASAESNIYVIANHTRIKGPVLAVLSNSSWAFSVLKFETINGNTFYRLEAGNVGSGVVINKVVYVDSSSVWQLADSANTNKHGIAIFGPNNTLILNGIYYNATLSLTPGANYYYDSTGSLTTTITPGLIGKAIDANTLLIASIGGGGSGSSAESILLTYWMV